MMSYEIAFLILLLMLLAFLKLLDDQQRSAVIYSFSGGRLGDAIVAYLHALWISCKYNIDFLYKLFRYSEQLAIHNFDTVPSPSLRAFSTIVASEVVKKLEIQPIDIDWYDRVFKKLVKQRIKAIYFI